MSFILTSKPTPATIITSKPTPATIITKTTEPGKNGRDGKDGKDGTNGINGTNGRDGRDYDPAELLALRTLIQTVQATIPLISAANTWSDTQTFAVRTQHNAGLTVRNGSLLQLNNPGDTVAASLSFDGNAINSTTALAVAGTVTASGIAIKPANSDADLIIQPSPDRYYSSIRMNSQTGATNATLITGQGSLYINSDTHYFRDNAGAVAGSIQNGRISFPKTNIPHVVSQPSPIDGDVWTTTAGMFVRVNGRTQTLAMLAADNTWTNPQAIDNGAVVNRYALRLTNLGGGTTGIVFISSAGGSMEIGSQSGPTWSQWSANRTMRYTVANSAYDSAPQAFLFQNQDADTRAVMRLKQVNASATGNILEATNSTDAVMAKIDYTGLITSTALAINTVKSAVRLSVENGDVNNATAKFRKTVPTGDNLIIDNVNSTGITNWIKFSTNNEQYVYGTIATDAYAIATKAQFNIQMMPGSLTGGSAKAGVTIGFNDNTQTPAAKLSVLAGAVDHVGLNVMGRTGATANLQTWSIYTGTGVADAPNTSIVARVDPKGKFAGSGVNLKPAAAPSTPSDGDMWTTADGVYVRIAGASYKLAMTAV